MTNLPPFIGADSLLRFFPGAEEVTFGVLGDAARDVEKASLQRPALSLAGQAIFPEIYDSTAQHRRDDGLAPRPRGSFAIVRFASPDDVNAVFAWEQAERELGDETDGGDAVERALFYNFLIHLFTLLC